MCHDTIPNQSLEVLDNGKPFNDAIGDVEECMAILRYYAGFTDKIHGKTIPADGDFVCMTRLEPVGVCGLIVPWNYPIMLMTLKIAPALAAGCTMIVKVSMIYMLCYVWRSDDD